MHIKEELQMRLIDADALAERICSGPPELIYTSTVIGMINDAPTVDAEPVVRCENCKSWDNSKDGRYFGGWCFCNIIQTSTPPNWYCAYGEARIGGIKTDEAD